MQILKKITAVMLCTVMLSGASFAAAVQPGESLSGTSAAAASAASAPKLNKGVISLGKGESFKLTANQSVKWRTSSSKIVTVDGSGNIKAAGTGTAWVTGKNSSGLENSCRITVKNAPSKVTISKNTLTLGVGETFTLSSTVPNGSAASKRTFRTSNSSVVKMTNTNWTGSFKAVKTGTAYVTVRTYNGNESSCKVMVKNAPRSVNISKKTLTLNVGQTATLSASIPQNTGCAKRTFRTSNSSVVKMTNTNWTGSFRAVKPGTAYVTVRTYNGKESSCKITVSKDWKTLYTEQLNECMSSIKYRSDATDMHKPMFQIFDADKNGIPELFVSTGLDHPGTCFMYEIVDGKVKKVNISSEYGVVYYNNNKGCLGYFGGGNGYYPTTIYKYKNNSLTKLFDGVSRQKSYSSPMEYYLWGSRVSESTYNSKLAPYEYSSVNWTKLGRSYYLTSAEVARCMTNS